MWEIGLDGSRTSIEESAVIVTMDLIIVDSDSQAGQRDAATGHGWEVSATKPIPVARQGTT